MLQNRRRRRIAKLIISGMGDSSPASLDDKPDYMNSEVGPTEEKSEEGGDAYKMAIGSMMMAIRTDDVDLMCRAFKAAYKACEMNEDY